MRVPETEVARILSLIAAEPGRRAKRRPDDLEGPYDYWFDGGAVSMLTQHIRYHFADGSEAYRAISPHRLSLTIVLPSKERVTIAQE